MLNKKLKRLAVYCSSRNGADPAFGRAAEELGRLMALREIELVYGGSSVGLMKKIADSVLRNGGEVTGVYPEGLFLEELHFHIGLAVNNLVKVCFHSFCHAINRSKIYVRRAVHICQRSAPRSRCSQ